MVDLPKWPLEDKDLEGNLVIVSSSRDGNVVEDGDGFGCSYGVLQYDGDEIIGEWKKWGNMFLFNVYLFAVLLYWGECVVGKARGMIFKGMWCDVSVGYIKLVNFHIRSPENQRIRSSIVTCRNSNQR